MKKNYLLSLVLCICFWGNGKTQHQTIFGSFQFNPEIYNPSFTGTGRAVELSLMHRNQWVGMEGAPVASSLNIQIPTKTKASLGFTALNDQSVLLNKTSFYSTFAYMVPIGKNHYLQFGLSGGMATQAIDMDNINTADPAILQAAQSQTQLLGQFGFHYRKENFILGFSVPQYQFTAPAAVMFKQDAQYYNTWKQRADMLMMTADYRLSLSQNVVLEPVVIYRMTTQSADQVELSGMLHLQDMVWIGSAYRQQNGFSAMAGIKIMKHLSIGYVYGMSSALGNSYSLGSHEFQMSFTAGKIKNIQR